jgi:(p)ppGpp synthase/HD superfamily hydrolase
MTGLSAVLKAADAAANWHVHQRRKASPYAPYVNHLLEVASLVEQASPGDAELVIAALLHDAVEDQDVSIELLERDFGRNVAGLVREVSENKTLSKEQRKHDQIDSAPYKSKKAKLIKLADMISNLRAIPDWSTERRKAYIDWSKKVGLGLRGVSPWLEQQFDNALEIAELQFEDGAHAG